MEFYPFHSIRSVDVTSVRACRLDFHGLLAGWLAGKLAARLASELAGSLSWLAGLAWSVGRSGWRLGFVGRTAPPHVVVGGGWVPPLWSGGCNIFLLVHCIAELDSFPRLFCTCCL